jgi:hypothetical protein
MLEIITTCIGGVFAIIAAALGAWISVKVREVHTMVNSQHDQMIAINLALKLENDTLKAEADDSGQH